MRLFTATLLVALTTGVSVASSRAHAADTQNLDTMLFKPAPGAYDVLGVASPRVSTLRRWRVFASSDYSYQPFRYLEGDATTTTFIYDRTSVALGGSFAFTNFLELGVMLPAAPMQQLGVHARLDPQLEPVPTSGMGDLVVSPKVEVFESRLFALGFVVPVTVPTHKDRAFLGRDDITVRPRALADVSLRFLRVSGSVGGVFRKNAAFLETDQSAAMDYGLAVEAPFWAGRQQFSFMATLVGEAGGVDYRVEDNPAELLAGVRWMSPTGLSATFGAGPGLTRAAGTPEYRVFGMLGFSAPDRQAHRARALARMQAQLEAAPMPEPLVPGPKVRIDTKARKVVIMDEIFFDHDRAEILPISYDILSQVAVTLREHPEINLLRIEGHTDDTGSSDYNLDLSERRAHNVMKFLIGAGVKASRLMAVGYGEGKPIDTQTTTLGRAANRRVEFTILSGEGTQQ